MLTRRPTCQLPLPPRIPLLCFDRASAVMAAALPRTYSASPSLLKPQWKAINPAYTPSSNFLPFPLFSPSSFPQGPPAINGKRAAAGAFPLPHLPYVSVYKQGIISIPSLLHSHTASTRSSPTSTQRRRPRFLTAAGASCRRWSVQPLLSSPQRTWIISLSLYSRFFHSSPDWDAPVLLRWCAARAHCRCWSSSPSLLPRLWTRSVRLRVVRNIIPPSYVLHVHHSTPATCRTRLCTFWSPATWSWAAPVRWPPLAASLRRIRRHLPLHHVLGRQIFDLRCGSMGPADQIQAYRSVTDRFDNEPLGFLVFTSRSSHL
jgi:hypothetical protein